MKLVWKILKSNISPWQLFGFAIANLLGISILLMTLQFHNDVYPSLSGENSLLEKDYLVVSKRAGFFSSLMGGKTQFEPGEVEKLQQQEEISDLGVFKAANFDIYGSVVIGGYGKVSSDIFFESVPDRFVDADDFTWSPDAEDTTIPVMIPKDYLDLYNYALAPSQNLPQLSESILKSLVMDVRLRGDGEELNLKAHITGFSKYLNTVLVPESFIDWANAKLASDRPEKIGRVLVSAKNPNDVNMVKKIEGMGYQIAQNKESYSKMTFFLNLVTGIILVVGVVISLLSFFILTLSIWLLIEKNQSKINALELLGYKSNTIAFPYAMLLGCVDLLTLAVAVGGVCIARNWYAAKLTSIVAVESGLGFTLAAAAILFAIIAVLHITVLIFTIRKVYKRK